VISLKRSPSSISAYVTILDPPALPLANLKTLPDSSDLNTEEILNLLLQLAKAKCHGDDFVQHAIVMDRRRLLVTERKAQVRESSILKTLASA
jgi:hypothetical protein